MNKTFDIFISYKRKKSLPTANNLYLRLTNRGYSTFYDLEEMGRGNYDVQLQRHIENAKDVFVILEEGSLDACKRVEWEKDWFCREIAFALEKQKNIIPILVGGYRMPHEDFFPKKLKELSLKESPEFSFTYFEPYLDKLVQNGWLLSQPKSQDKTEEQRAESEFQSKETLGLYREAVQGNEIAQAKLALYYSKGNGVPQSDKISAFWYEISANRGYDMAQLQLGFCYFYAIGVAKNDAVALIWFKKAAEQGLPEAQYLLGIMYSNGLGVPQDVGQAELWFEKAAKQGHKQAQQELKELRQ